MDSSVIRPSVRIHDEEGLPRVSERISTHELYSLRDTLSPALRVAFRLLEEAIDRVDDAISLLRDGDQIGSDDQINRLQALLPELFCCRSLGDAFGAIVGAVHHGIKNMGGAPLDEQKLIALRQVLKTVHSEPFLAFDEAVDAIIGLEEIGFVVEPSEFEKLADFLDD